MEDTEVISHYNSIVDRSGVSNVTDELRESLLANMLRLYLRVRAFSLARNVFGKHKLSAKTKRAKGLLTDIKKSTDKPTIKD